VQKSCPLDVQYDSYPQTQTAPPDSYSASLPYHAVKVGNGDEEDAGDGPPMIESFPWPWLGAAASSTAVAAARMATAKADVQVQFEKKYTNVSVKWEGTNGTKLSFSFSAPKNAQVGTFGALGFTTDNHLADDAKAALAAVNKMGDFPTGGT